MQWFKNKGRLVGIFDFPILQFEEGTLSTGGAARGFINAGVHPMITKSTLDPIFEIIIDGWS